MIPSIIINGKWQYDTDKENLEEKIKSFDRKNFNAIGLIKKSYHNTKITNSEIKDKILMV